MAMDFLSSLADAVEVELEESSDSECNDPVSWGYFIHGSLVPAALIILILSHMQRRLKPYRAEDCCHRYYALIYPINLLDNCNNRTAYSLAFGATASLMLDLFYGTYAQYYAQSVDEFWIKILIGGFATIEIGLACYPYFACISTPSRLTGSSLGFMYVSFWFTIQLTLNILCPDRPGTYFRYQSLVAQFPVLICMFLLAMYFLFTFIDTIKERHHTDIKPTLEEKMMKTHHAIYVQELLKKPVTKVYTGWEAKVYARYAPKDGFKYPTRICATFVVAVICMYQLSLPMIAGGRVGLQTLFYLILQGAPIYFKENNFTEATVNETLKIIGQTQTAADTSLVIGSCIAIALQLLYVGHIFVCYRKHVLRLYQGDRLFLPKDAITSQDAIVGNLKYCGYQIAYFLSGYIIITYVLFALVLIFSTLIIMPLINNAGFFFYVIANFLVPAAIIGAIVFSSQNILAKFYFLQPKLNEGDKDKPMALQHRQWYHNFSYLLVFLNTLLGLISALVRIIRGTLLGIFLLSRIDRPVLMRGYEIKDNAYKVYVGNLNMINQHSHPVLIVFCQLLINEYILPGRTKRYTSHRPGEGYGAMDESPSHDRTVQGRRKKAAIFHWQIAYTLLNNPSIIGTRKRSRALSFADTHRRIDDLANPNKYNQILMPHAQQLMIRTQARKGDIVEPQGVTLDDLVMTDSAAPIVHQPTTPNSTELDSFTSPLSEAQLPTPDKTLDEATSDKTELIEEDGNSDSDDKSSTPLQAVV
ncbi:stimulated by retinoic acid gene 6 protein-like isoform X2 [Amphiura filiformis]|uniref:stimulated by retinoic acid gene 6 protein-like isoform X2 n=1 Tax=Amphiura filiformis TaxID=82378 RepID=UPI003B225382